MKNDFELFSDSCANLSDAQIDELGVNIIALKFVVDGELRPSYVKGRENNLKPFYDILRNGKVLTTSSLNEQEYIEAFTPALENGKDVLYLGFSSGLSLSFSSSLSAKATLEAKYPDRKIICIDTLAASYGQGLLVYYAAKMKNTGKTIDEIAAWNEENKLKLAHWFTVEDLIYLFRGGRVKRVSYWIGKIAQIKPVLHVDNNGHLIPVYKVIGRKKSIAKLAEKIAETITEPEKQVIFVAHGDCENDANILVEKIKSLIPVKDFVLNILDPVIGCHSGPGTLAVFALATER